MTDIVLLNRSGHISMPDLTAATAAFQTQISRDFAPVWGGDAKLWDEDEDVPANAWKFWLQDGLDQPGDLGYHLMDGALPEGKIDIEGAINSGNDWRTVVSHELLETLCDPLCTRMAGPYIVEPCDPVEESMYLINGLAVSNFVYPVYFGLMSGTQYDYNNELKASVPAMLSGGYVESWNGSQWISQFARLANGGMPWMFIRPSGRRHFRASRGAP
jgi:hypothetical protein